MIRPRKTVEEIVRYAVPQSGRYEKLRLDKNENCVGLPASVLKVILQEASGHVLSAYPEPYTLYRRLAMMHDVGVDQVLVTAGSEMAIRYIFEAYIEPGDSVLVLNPSFAMFEVYARLCGARVVSVNYDQNLKVSVAAIERQISAGVKLVAIANPNNPTGSVIPGNALLRIIRRAQARDTIVLVDEAYFQFYGRTIIGAIAKYGNLLVTRTFSKGYGAAGIRLGCAVGDSSLISNVAKLQPIDHVSAFAVLVGNYLLDHPKLVDLEAPPRLKVLSPKGCRQGATSPPP